MKKTPLYLEILDNYGRYIATCPEDHIARLLPQLLRKHMILRVELARTPKDAMVLATNPFQSSPTFCVASKVEGSDFVSVRLEVPILLARGSETRVLLEVTTKLDPVSFKKNLRKTLHKQIPLNTDAQSQYSEWYDSVIGDSVVDIVTDLLLDEAYP